MATESYRRRGRRWSKNLPRSLELRRRALCKRVRSVAVSFPTLTKYRYRVCMFISVHCRHRKPGRGLQPMRMLSFYDDALHIADVLQRRRRCLIARITTGHGHSSCISVVQSASASCIAASLPRRNPSARRAAPERVRTPRFEGVDQSLHDSIKEQISEMRVRGGAKGKIDRKVEVARGRGRGRGRR